MKFPSALLAPAAALALAPAALAQEAMYTAAATMPSNGTFVLRTQPHYWRFGSNPESGVEHTDKVEVMNTLAYGLDRGLALFVDVPVEQTSEEDASGNTDSHTGVEGVHAMLKWRVYQLDSGGVDTERIALLGGAAAEFGDGWHVDPMVGGVYTLVRGRHGFNQDLFFRLTTGGDEADNFGGEGPSDAIFFNTSYLYRIAPAAYSSDTRGAWYVTAEINGLYETNGDTELRWSPGLMYEGRRWAFELMAQFPLWQEVENRAELDMGFGFGFRVVF